MASSPDFTLRCAIFSVKLGIRSPACAIARSGCGLPGETLRIFDQIDQLAQKCRASCAIGNAMVDGKVQHNSRLHGQSLFDPWPFTNLPNRENGTLARCDDRLELIDPVHAQVAQRCY